MKAITTRGTLKLLASLTAVGLAFFGLSAAQADTTYQFSFTGDDFEIRNNGALVSSSNGDVELRMTPLAGSQKGGVFSKEPLNLQNSFILDGEIYLGDETANGVAGFDTRGADGAAFTLIRAIPANVSSTGDGLGYSGLSGVFAVEWDTYHNGTKGDLGSEGNDMSMALTKNTADHTVSGSTYADVELIPRSTMIADDGTWRKFQIAWNGPAEKITVSFDLDSSGSFSADEVIFEQVSANLTGDGGLFESSNDQAYWGFTASTGLYVNYQGVRFASNALKVIVPPPPPYVGPVLSAPPQISATPGERVVIPGTRLGNITAASIDDVAVEELEVSSTEVSFIVPDVTPGLKSLVVTSDQGRLTVQDCLTVLPAKPVISPRQSSEAAPSIRRIGSNARVAISNVVGNGKVQILLNGDEVAWVRAVDESDPKLRSNGDDVYLVRTLVLVPGKKNVIEVHQDGLRLRRVAYSVAD